MSRKPDQEDQPPSFINILLANDFAHTLKIPCKFVKKHLNGKLIEKPLLKTDRSSEPWPVGMEKIGRDYYFKIGWSDFVKDNNLERADILLFWLISHSTFFVTVYDPTCCEKPFEIPSSPSSSSFSLSEDNICTNEKNPRTDEESRDVDTENPYFEATITKCHRSRIRLPAGFVRLVETFLHKQSILLRNEEGKKWEVKTHLRTNVRSYELAWHHFRKENKIRESDVCSFEFRRDEGDLVDVRVLDRTKRSKHIRVSKKNPCCEVLFTKARRYRMSLPMRFAKEAGLLKSSRTVLRNEKGRQWSVDICLREDVYIFELVNGWREFQQENGLKESDVCLFEFCREEGNLINVRVLKSNCLLTKSSPAVQGKKKIVQRENKTSSSKRKTPTE